MTTQTRRIILRTLRSKGKCDIKELAEAAGVSPVSVRHHISNLQADQLIEAAEVRQGVGRPHYVYSLTDLGMESFPKRYVRLTNRLLEEMKDTLPEEKIRELLKGIAASMAQEYAGQLEGQPLPERIRRLRDFLTEEGFETEIHDKGDHWILRELACPYVRLSMRHPEICNVDRDFIATALSLPVERVNCLASGDSFCTFEVRVGEALEEA
jgi:DeoR family suf operon transcriptional repressor